MTTINVNAQSAYRTRVIYDTATGVNGGDANTSVVAQGPRVVQLDTIGAATTVLVQSRVHASAEWFTEATKTSADGPVQVVFSTPKNFVRVIRSAGTGAVKAYAQD